MIVFTVSGLWHGAAYTFLIWGALHGICMVIERLVYGDKIKTISNNFSLINVFRISLTFTIVTFAWIFFRVSDFGDVMTIFRKILTEPGSLFIDADTLAYAFLFTILILIVDFMEEYFSGKVTFMNSKYTIVRWISYVVMVVMVLLFGVLDGGSFIYFQF